MRSARPKVLHSVGHLPMVLHVLNAVAAAGLGRVALVVGHGGDKVAAVAAAAAPEATVVRQDGQLGTAHAVLAARAALEGAAADEPVVVLYGDAPLVRAETIAAMADLVAGGAALAVLGFHAADPTGYGRLLMAGERLLAIREERDANDAERAIDLCNAGVMALRAADALPLLDAISNDNAKGEYYLTDAVEIAVGRGLETRVALAEEAEVTGVNDRRQLAAAEALFQHRMRLAAMAAGVTLVAPETVFFSHDTRLAEDVTVEPNVVFGPGVTVGPDATIRAFSHLEGADIAAGAVVGPYARVRPDSRIGENARIGNFVEIKASVVAAGAKVNHLAYIGDSAVGAGANVGAGTITCNYDGVKKSRTEIGEGAFIGSNTALVAPVAVGRNALVAAGSVITEDVPDDALAVGRGRQVIKPGRSPFRTGR